MSKSALENAIERVQGQPYNADKRTKGCQRCGYDPNANQQDVPTYIFGSPKQRILAYLTEVGMLPSTAKLMQKCGIGSLHDAGCALDELIKEGIVDKIKRKDGVTEFYLA